MSATTATGATRDEAFASTRSRSGFLTYVPGVRRRAALGALSLGDVPSTAIQLLKSSFISTIYGES